MQAILTRFYLSFSCVFFPLSEYGTTRINIFPLAAAWGLYGCMATDGRAAKQWAVAAVT